MTKIQLPEVDKPKEQTSSAIGDVPLLPTTIHQVVVTKKKQLPARNRSCIVLVLLSMIFAVLTIKKICDLKEENLMLMKQLSLERQKDSMLRLAVRDNIPPSRFLGHQFTEAETAVVEGDARADTGHNSGWTINLSVLWSSPGITVCDMRRLSYILAHEIYSRGSKERQEVRAAPWMEIAGKEKVTDESSEEYNDSEEYDSSEESKEVDEVLKEIEQLYNSKSSEEVNEVLKDIETSLLENEDYLAEPEWLTEEAEDYLEELAQYDYLQNLEGVYDTLGLAREFQEDPEYSDDDLYY